MSMETSESTGNTESTKPKFHHGLLNLRPWAKGQSGNKAGRPKQNRELVLLARKHVHKAIKMACEFLINEDMEPSVRMDAAKFLRDTGMGKPGPMVIESDPISELSDDELFKKLNEAIAKRAKQTGAEQ